MVATQIALQQNTLGNAARPPPISGITLQWETSSGACHDVDLHHIVEQGHLPSFCVQGVAPIDLRARSYWPGAEICLAPAFPASTLASAWTSAGVIFSIAAMLLGNDDSEAISGTTGELVWLCSQKQTVPPASWVCPVLLGDVRGEFPQRERISIIPSLQVGDPLQYHIALVLQTAAAAKGRAERLYAETLADALMAHFLRRYRASHPVCQPQTSGLIPCKLRRTLAYIQAHLTQTLSLGTLAEVAHMSPTHFAHLFKQATGLAPHRYVVLCRIERAKQLLSETTMPLIDIGPEVGFSDQSHFTALFRKYVSLTPKTYRDATAWG